MYKEINIKLSQEHVSSIEAVVDATVAEFIKSIPHRMERALKDMMFASLGFRESFDRLAVSNESNPIADLIVEKAQAATKDAITRANIDTLPPEAIKAIREKFIYEVDDYLRTNIKKLVENHIDESIASMFKDEKLNIQLSMGGDIKDPKYMANMPNVREILLEALVKKEIK